MVSPVLSAVAIRYTGGRKPIFPEEDDPCRSQPSQPSKESRTGFGRFSPILKRDFSLRWPCAIRCFSFAMQLVSHEFVVRCSPPIFSSPVVVTGRSNPHRLALDDDSRALASELIALFAEAVGQRRSHLDGVLAAFEGEDTAFKVKRGLAHLLANDFCTFETVAPLDPTELRERVFALGAESTPSRTRRDAVLAHAADSLARNAAGSSRKTNSPPGCSPTCPRARCSRRSIRPRPTR